MKTAKEWAESVVIDADCDACRTFSRIQDHDNEDLAVRLQEQHSWAEEAQKADDARTIIERLVERVQADARAPLDAEIARLRAENDRLVIEIGSTRADLRQAQRAQGAKNW